MSKRQPANPEIGPLFEDRVIVKSVFPKPKPYGWVICAGERQIIIETSEDRFRSLQEAYEAGSAVLTRRRNS